MSMMTDNRLYRWAGTELELIEIVVDQNSPSDGIAELKSLQGFEDLVACVLEPVSCQQAPDRRDRPLAA